MWLKFSMLAYIAALCYKPRILSVAIFQCIFGKYTWALSQWLVEVYLIYPVGWRTSPR